MVASKNTHLCIGDAQTVGNDLPDTSVGRAACSRLTHRNGERIIELGHPLSTRAWCDIHA